MLVTYEIDRDTEYITADFYEHTMEWVVDQPGFYERDELTFEEMLNIIKRMPLGGFPFDIIAADFAAAIHKKEETDGSHA